MIISEYNITFRDNTNNTLNSFQHTQEVNKVWLMFPAMGVRASYYHSFAEVLAVKTKDIVIPADLRGIGNSSVRASRSIDFGYQDYIEDIQEIILWVEDKFPNKEINLCGHSLGGQLACIIHSLLPNKINKTYLIASGLPFYKGWKGLQQIRPYLVGLLFGPISSIVGYFPGNAIGFGGKEARTVMNDWSKVVRNGKYIFNNSSINYDAVMGEVDIKVLAISFDGDDFAPKTSVRNLLLKLSKSIDIQHINLTGFNHFNWAKNPDLIIETMITI